MNCLSVREKHDPKISPLHLGHLAPKAYATICLDFLLLGRLNDALDPVIADDHTIGARSNGFEVFCDDQQLEVR
jgi:hypothetical protein